MTDNDATTEAELRAIFAHLDPVPQLLEDGRPRRLHLAHRGRRARRADARQRRRRGGGWCARARRATGRAN